MDLGGQAVVHSQSRIFAGFRSIGQVSNHVPVLTRYIHRRRQNFVVTVVGKSFNTYASKEFKHLSVSSTLLHEIKCTAVDTYHVYTGSGNEIQAWRRGTEIKHRYYGHKADVILILPYGEYLLSIDDDGKFCIFNIKSEDLLWEMDFPVNTFKPVCLMHPATYLNKVLIASDQGEMQLWNIRKGALIHHFPRFRGTINIVIQAPAIDVVAIGFNNRMILFYNIRFGEEILKFWGMQEPISMSFRTDEKLLLIVGCADGSITVWDVEQTNMVSHIEKVHDGPVTGLQCFPQEPLFVTSSPDNSIKAWIFDLPDGGFRLLNSRDGHSQPPTKIKFHGESGYSILSGGQDSSFRVFHIYNDTCSRSISKSKLTAQKMSMHKDFADAEVNKMPTILDFTSQTVACPKHHEDVAARHEGQIALSTWSVPNSKKGAHNLVLPKYKKQPKAGLVATCLCITSCGQFVIGGYSDGTVEKFNIQSGVHRLTFGNKTETNESRDSKDIPHSGPVTGVAVDQVSSRVVTSGADSYIKIWDFKSGLLISEIAQGVGVSFMFSHRLTNLTGVVLDNFHINIVDMNTGKIFRHFETSSSVLSACFSPDNRWVTASTSDCLVRTWDIPTSKLIDIFRLESMVCSMEYSPNGEFLATAIHDNNGIFLWMNRQLFLHISLMPIPNDFEPPLLEFCHESAIVKPTDMDDEEVDDIYLSPAQLNDKMITLSNLPASRWKSLFNLEEIRARNKLNVVVKRVNAPFFLGATTAPPNTPVSSASASPRKAMAVLNIDDTQDILTALSTQTSSASSSPTKDMNSLNMEDTETAGGTQTSSGSSSPKPDIEALIRANAETVECTPTSSAHSSPTKVMAALSLQDTKADEDIQAASEILKGFELKPCLLGQKLEQMYGFEDRIVLEEVMKLLGDMGPSQIDNEIAGLGPLNGGSVSLLSKFAAFLRGLVMSNKYFECSQAYLAVFMKKHGEVIQENPLLVADLKMLQGDVRCQVNNIFRDFNTIMSFTYFSKSSLL